MYLYQTKTPYVDKETTQETAQETTQETKKITTKVKIIYAIAVNAVLFLFAWLSMKNPSWETAFLGIYVLYLYAVVRFVDTKKAFQS